MKLIEQVSNTLDLLTGRGSTLLKCYILHLGVLALYLSSHIIFIGLLLILHFKANINKRVEAFTILFLNHILKRDAKFAILTNVYK